MASTLVLFWNITWRQRLEALSRRLHMSMSSSKRRADVGGVNAKVIQVLVETRAVVVGNA